MLKKVRTAIVGCGNISNIYCKNLKNMFQIIDLAAVCDLNETAARTRAEEYGLRVMAMEELCRDEEIELVVNLTGPGAHYAVIKTLLEAGKNVYTEKPACRGKRSLSGCCTRYDFGSGCPDGAKDSGFRPDWSADLLLCQHQPKPAE